MSTLYRAHHAVAAIAIVVIVGLSGYRIAQWYRSVPEDWRGATAYVARERHPGDTVVVAPPWAIDAFRYYDQATPLGARLSTGRTFILVFGSFQSPAKVVTDVFGKTGLRPARDVSFGRRLVVRVLAPASSGEEANGRNRSRPKVANPLRDYSAVIDSTSAFAETERVWPWLRKIRQPWLFIYYAVGFGVLSYVVSGDSVGLAVVGGLMFATLMSVWGEIRKRWHRSDPDD